MIQRLLFIGLTLFGASPALGNTLTVTNTDDAGVGSLRDAISIASADDTIVFDLAYPATITLSSPLVLGVSLAIDGPGISSLTISGDDSVQVFQISSGIVVRISGLTIQKGRAMVGGVGGGIFNLGTLILNNSAVTGNSASAGGGIYVAFGTATLTNSAVTGNAHGGIYSYNSTLTLSNSIVSENDGGGVYFVSYRGDIATLFSSTISGNSFEHCGAGLSNGGLGILRLIDSTVSGNSSGDRGGGICNSGSLMLVNSTVSGNSAYFYGGGVYNTNRTTVVNSTLSGNLATFGGAGIYSNHGDVSLTHSTVSGNFATTGGGLTGGGLHVNGFLTIKNTLLANHRFGGGNCYLTPGSLGVSSDHNFSDDVTCSGFLTAASDLNNTPAELDPAGLQDNGGPTRTIALMPTSQAIEAIPINDCTAMDGTTPILTDQRGVPRPQGAACDIGAFERKVFSSFSVKLDVYGGRAPGFDLKANFTLDPNSNGIDPITEALRLQVGPYQVTLPPGSFRQLKQGSYILTSVIDGVSVSFHLSRVEDDFELSVVGSPVDLTALTNPVRVALIIGDESGATSVFADFRR